MNLDQRIIALAQGMGASVKLLGDDQGNLASLNTTAKTSLVAAINELLILPASQPSGAQIDDTASIGDDSVVWSADRIIGAIETAKIAVRNDLLGGASEAFDTLKELFDALRNNPNFTTETGISKALKRIGVSKKNILEHSKACPVKRAIYLAKLDDYIAQGFAIFYMDESGFKSEMMRPSGYEPIGSPCIGNYNWQATDRTNIIGALYGQTLFALDCLKTNINKEVFYSWCKFTLIPKLKRKCVIVMDNATFHKRVQKLLNRHGHRLLFLPPYSPDLNPIEKKWA